MTRVLTIITLLFATPAWAESRAMNCNDIITYKYETGFWGTSATCVWMGVGQS